MWGPGGASGKIGFMSLSPGQRLGPYEIDREVGRGGMGVVYRARDTRLDRDVAIKALPDDSATPDRLARFDREAKALARLDHPGIAGIYGVEEHGGSKYLVLEFVEGETLADRLRSGPLTVGDAVRIGAQIAAGLEAAHDAGVIHRDLKPGNVMLTATGRAKLLDFGLAASDQGTSVPVSDSASTRSGLALGSTTPGAVIGTAGYMSPEQARGESVGRGADVWSFGVVLYEMLGGVSPFARATMSESIAAVLGAEVDDGLLPTGLPSMLMHVLARCMERDPSRRWGSMGAVRIELEDLRTVPLESTLSTGYSTHRYRLSDGLCKEMDRGGFDARVLGWEMQYAENEKATDAAIIWVPSFGADHTMARHRQLMEMSPIRMVTPTPIGMEPDASIRPSLSMGNQAVALRGLASVLRSRLGVERLLIGGSSCGGVLALRCVADGEGGLFDGLLLIDPDIQESDCFVTRLFADLDDDSGKSAIDAARQVSARCQTLDEWISMHEYFIQCIGKVRDDITPLIEQGRGFVDPFRGVCAGADSPFIDWLRDACPKVGAVRCVFPDSAAKHKIVGDIRLLHLDDERLGPCFDESSFRFGDVRTHFELLDSERVAEQIRAFVSDLEAGTATGVRRPGG